MSLILDALNRSRRDSEQVPGLSSVHAVEPVAAGVAWIPWVLVAVLALAVLVIGWRLFYRLPQPETAAGVPAAVTAPAARGLHEKSRPVPDTIPSRVEAPPVTSRSSPIPKPVPSGEAAPEAVTAVSPPPRAPVDPSVAALYQQQQQAVAESPPEATTPRAQQPASQRPRVEGSTGAVREEVPVDLERLVAKARAELADARLTEHEVPLLSALSQQTKDDIPTLMYQQHDYSGDPARSSVVINGKILQAGGTVVGVKVVEVLPDSVVLEFKGSRFRLRALNSWVNL